MADVVVIDSGGANLASLLHALTRLGARAEVSSVGERIRAASHVLLPGVGSANNAMLRLKAANLDGVIPTLTQPLLGICLGMQLLFSSSAEAVAGAEETACLGIIPDKVVRMAAAAGRPVPHMGWNQIDTLRQDPLLSGIAPTDYVYFVHSYAAPVGNATVATTEYGGQFSSVVRERNFRGVQFHPERSATVGARLLDNFLALGH
jgi:imidazole glycerol-phosphate synthase subunit HisH